jgi:hypothetical protein
MTLSRRDFLVTAGLSLPAMGGMVVGCQSNPFSPKAREAFPGDVRARLVPPRLTIAMWDFSWWYQHHPEGYYENFEMVMDQLRERGFNTVRIDAFPLVIGCLKSENEKVTPSSPATANWGHIPETFQGYAHPLVPELIEFMHVAKRNGVGVILSSWGQQVREYANARTQAAGPEGLAAAWKRTLGILRREGLLDHVRYVDLDQEFPYFSPFLPRLEQLGKAGQPGTLSDAQAMEAATAKLAWNRAQLDFVKQSLERTIDLVHEDFADLRMTFSLTSYWDEIKALRIKNFGALELHIWIHSPEFDAPTGFNELAKDRDPGRDYKAYQAAIDKVLAEKWPALLAMMEGRMAKADAWAREWGLPLTTTEAWGPWWHMDHPDLTWQWLYDWCEYCLAMAQRHGFWGVTPWNYSHPYWENWKNVAWYRKVNGAFLACAAPGKKRRGNQHISPGPT